MRVLLLVLVSCIAFAQPKTGVGVYGGAWSDNGTTVTLKNRSLSVAAIINSSGSPSRDTYLCGSAPPTPPAGKGVAYCDSADKKWKWKDDAGVVSVIGSGGSGGGGTPNPPGYLTIDSVDYLLPTMIAASKPTALTLTPYAAPTITTHANGSKTFAAGADLHVVEQAYTTETTFTAAFTYNLRADGGSGTAAITLRIDGGFGAICGFEKANYDPYPLVSMFWRLNSANPPGWAADYVPSRQHASTGLQWVRYVISGDNCTCQTSSNGYAWDTIGSFSISSWSMQTMNRAGIAISRGSMHLLYWKAE